MAQITITIGAAKYARAVTAIAARNGYQDTVPGATPQDPPVANPVTKELFLEAWLKGELVRETRQYENRVAELAATAAINNIDFN